ncbi:hypothetical protein VTI74DRAFT_108 [Chaetomium olivicolor]
MAGSHQTKVQTGYGGKASNECCDSELFGFSPQTVIGICARTKALSSTGPYSPIYKLGPVDGG